MYVGKADAALFQHAAVLDDARTSPTATRSFPAFLLENSLAIGCLECVADAILQPHQIFFDGGNMTGCGRLGVAYARGMGISKNESRAADLLQRACTEGRSFACNALGTMTANGRGGLTRDSVKAIGFWRQACTARVNNAESCANLGAGYLRGAGVMRDDVRAGQYLSQGCEGGAAAGCTQLASMYEAGTSVTAKSVTRAAEFYKRGCAGGDQQACEWVRKNPQPAAPKK
jgi:TPR repeat protein